MVRLASVALLLAVVASPGWSQTSGPAPKHISPEAWRAGEPGVRQPRYVLPGYPVDTGYDSSRRTFAGTEFSPNSRLGLGVFGPKRGSAAMPPVTVYEVNTRQTRKTGVGFSLKF
jgi:hypothetical protein